MTLLPSYTKSPQELSCVLDILVFEKVSMLFSRI